jgi:hypothetical protein
MKKLPKHGAVRSGDLPTAHKASMRVDAEKKAKQVYFAIRKSRLNGATCDEVCEATGIDYRTVSPRMKPLREMKWIKWAFDANGRPLSRIPITKTGKRKHCQQTIYFSNKHTSLAAIQAGPHPGAHGFSFGDPLKTKPVDRILRWIKKLSNEEYDDLIKRFPKR